MNQTILEFDEVAEMRKSSDYSYEINTPGSEKRIWADALAFILALIIVVPIAMCALNDSFAVYENAFRVSGSSMDPTLKDSQLVAVSPVLDRPENGTIIICRVPEAGYQFLADGVEEYIVKRIIAGPGETVDIGADDVIMVNGIAIEESYLTEAAKSETYLANYPAHCELSEDEYFVIGDNRGHSCDSRYFGAVRFDEIVGVVNENTPDFAHRLAKVIICGVGLAALYLLVNKLLTAVLCKVFKT